MAPVDLDGPAPLFFAEFVGGPLDGWTEIREGPLPVHVRRKWYSFDPGNPGCRKETVFYYALSRADAHGASIEYWLSEEQSPPTPE